jgi:hypothetical protein
MKMWSTKVLKISGNGIGKFLDLEENFSTNVDKRVVRILVEIDLCEGLLEEFEISWGKWNFTQDLDYWDIPFRYMSCHIVAHI